MLVFDYLKSSSIKFLKLLSFRNLKLFFSHFSVPAALIISLSTSSCDGPITDPCDDIAYYGPPPCTSDEQCRIDNGSENWYCDPDNTVGEGECAVKWAVCTEIELEDPCGDIVYYGPAPCISDDQCQADNGSENWYCDTENTIGEGECAVNSPVCVEKEDSCGDIVYYGPAPCISNQQCQDMKDSPNWYCDTENTFGEGECAVNWPVCKEMQVIAYYGITPIGYIDGSLGRASNGWYGE